MQTLTFFSVVSDKKLLRLGLAACPGFRASGHPIDGLGKVFPELEGQGGQL